MSESGDLTIRFIKRERQIYLTAQEQGAKKRSVPMPMLWKLLDAAEFALNNGYDSPNYRKQREAAMRAKDSEEIISETEPVL